MVDWYVMLFPSDRLPRRYLRLAERWAAEVGGAVNPTPHVTVAYLVGPADPAGVVAAVRAIPGRAITVETDRAISYSQVPHPLFGYSASLRVIKTAELSELHGRVVRAVEPLGLRSLYVWDEVDPHLQVLRHMPVHPREALPRLNALAPRYAFRTARLVLSRPMADGTFPVCLSRRLRAPLPGRIASTR